MNQQPDKFFRDKLQSYEKPVSSDAWKRVAQNLSKKNDRVIWFRFAAAVALLVTSTLLILPVLKKNSVDPLANNKTMVENDTSTIADPTPNAAQPTITEDTTAEPAPNENGNTVRIPQTVPRLKQPRDQNKAARSVDHQPEIPLTASNEGAEQPTAEVYAEKNIPLTTEGSITANAVEKKKSLTIVFTSEEVNEKYLTKKTDAHATADEKEASGLRKLLDKAYDLKHNQDPLGDLRQKKNEILAMNFRNDKRTQND